MSLLNVLIINRKNPSGVLGTTMLGTSVLRVIPGIYSNSYPSENQPACANVRLENDL